MKYRIKTFDPSGKEQRPVGMSIDGSNKSWFYASIGEEGRIFNSLTLARFFIKYAETYDHTFKIVHI